MQNICVSFLALAANKICLSKSKQPRMQYTRIGLEIEIERFAFTGMDFALATEIFKKGKKVAEDGERA